MKTIAFDFSGTLIKTEIIEEANKLRADILQRALPTKEEHAHSENLYKINREFVEKLTGLNSSIKYRGNNLEESELSKEEAQNQISTTLFQMGMYMAAKKHQKDIFVEGILEQLKKLKGKGYKIAIVSGIRTDIISGMLKIAKIDLFDFIKGQPPKLGLSNEELLKELDDVIAFVGDKFSDLEPANKLGIKSIFVKWGHPTGGEEEISKVVVEKVEELISYI